MGKLPITTNGICFNFSTLAFFAKQTLYAPRGKQLPPEITDSNVKSNIFFFFHYVHSELVVPGSNLSELFKTENWSFH